MLRIFVHELVRGLQNPLSDIRIRTSSCVGQNVGSLRSKYYLLNANLLESLFHNVE